MTTPRPAATAQRDHAARPARLTTEEVADEIRGTVPAVCRMIRTGELPARKILGRWLVERRDLDRWIAAQPDNATARELAAVPA